MALHVLVPQNLPISTVALVLHHQHHPYVVVNTAEMGGSGYEAIHGTSLVLTVCMHFLMLHFT